MVQKWGGKMCHFLVTLGHFGAFLALKEPLGTQRELFKNLRILHFLINVETPCQISEKYSGQSLRIWNVPTHRRMDGGEL